MNSEHSGHPGQRTGPDVMAPALAGISTLAELQNEAETRLCSLRRIADQLKEVVDGTRHTGQVINLASIETRTRYIAAMKSLHSELNLLVAQVAQYGMASEAMHRDEIRVMQESLKRAGGSAGAGPAEPKKLLDIAPSPGTKRATSAWNNPDTVARLAPLRPIMSDISNTARGQKEAVRIGNTGGQTPITLEALVVSGDLRSAKDITAAIGPQGLHFVPQWNHFALKIDGVVFHANMAQIYNRFGVRRMFGNGGAQKRLPEKVRACGYPACGKPTTCQYYHDPALFPGSRDVRNFTAESFIYAPPIVPARGAGPFRRFGSIENLDADLRLISRDEARLFMDQVAHEVLCALVLHKYILARQE